jgi:predicted secreted Zn-dependent protease
MSLDFSETEWRVYDVDADSLAAVAEAISRLSEAAQAEWFPAYEFTTSRGRLATVAVTVGTRVTMPRWTGRPSAPAAEQAEWTRFCDALREHEQGHIDLVMEHLSGVDERLLGQSVTAARRIWQQALESLEAASGAYDRQTDHGRNQGTVIDISIGVL